MPDDHADDAALQRLTVDELAGRRRALVRALDRVTRHRPIDELEQARILRDADAIDRVQRTRAHEPPQPRSPL